MRSVWLKAHCSKGTYIRTLGEDIGIALGCGAFLSALRRVQSGQFAIGECVSLEALGSLCLKPAFPQLRAVDSLLDSHHPITLQPDDAGRFPEWLAPPWRLARPRPSGCVRRQPAALLGTAHVRAGELIPERLLNPQEIQSLLESAA